MNGVRYNLLQTGDISAVLLSWPARQHQLCQKSPGGGRELVNCGGPGLRFIGHACLTSVMPAALSAVSASAG
jgi:hypothetical protein